MKLQSVLLASYTDRTFKKIRNYTTPYIFVAVTVDLTYSRDSLKHQINIYTK